MSYYNNSTRAPGGSDEAYLDTRSLPPSSRSSRSSRRTSTEELPIAYAELTSSQRPGSGSGRRTNTGGQGSGSRGSSIRSLTFDSDGSFEAYEDVGDTEPSMGTSGDQPKKGKKKKGKDRESQKKKERSASQVYEGNATESTELLTSPGAFKTAWPLKGNANAWAGQQEGSALERAMDTVTAKMPNINLSSESDELSVTFTIPFDTAGGRGENVVVRGAKGQADFIIRRNPGADVINRVGKFIHGSIPQKTLEGDKLRIPVTAIFNLNAAPQEPKSEVDITTAWQIMRIAESQCAFDLKLKSELGYKFKRSKEQEKLDAKNTIFLLKDRAKQNV